MKEISKHSEISREILKEIKEGTYKPGDRLPSEAVLVQRFNVSRPTVARALRDLQAKGLIRRRVGSGTYVCGPADSKSISSNQLGLIIPSFQMTGIFEPISGELANLARTHGYFFHWGGVTAPLPDQETVLSHAIELCEQFIGRGVKGVFFAPFELTEHNEADSWQIVNRLKKAGIPVVLLDRDLTPFPSRSEFDLACVDNVTGGFVVAEHLIKEGCRRLIFVARCNSAPSVKARLSGMREAILAHGLTPIADYVKIGDVEDQKFIDALIDSRTWDGAVCANDLTAAHLLRALEKKGVRVPKDVRITGFDNAKFAALLGVSLTTVDQPCRAIAAAAFRAMLDRIVQPNFPSRQILLTPELVVRESSGFHGTPLAKIPMSPALATVE